MPSDMPMIPGLEDARPSGRPYLPGFERDPDSVPAAEPRRLVELRDGDTLRLEAGFVRRRLGERTVVMYGFNQQYPGPLIRVPAKATVTVEFRNAIDRPSTIHWHGVRLENRFDGVPYVTQDPVEPGGRFVYQIYFADAGIYWYHPHVREDVQQDLGLYGSIRVDPAEAEYYPPAHREVVLMLDDILMDDQGFLPYGDSSANHALMGRFGNLLLVNGEPSWELEVDRGEVLRFFLTNVSNTRTFNLSFGDLGAKLLAADIGRFEREQWIESILIGPAQRYVVDVRFEEGGTVPFVNAIQAINHFMGEFEPRTDTLGTVRVNHRSVSEDLGQSFEDLRENAAVRAELDSLRRYLSAPPDRVIRLTVEVGGLPSGIQRMMALDTVYAPPLEFNDAMPLMNWISTTDEVRWILRDSESGRENMDIDWDFETGDLVKLRLVNDPRSQHPMNHPIHLHGQRFVVLARDGESMENLAWKDTVIVPVGSAVDILVEFTNPGDWMLHCHISEHLEAGMRTVFHVDGESLVP